MVCTGVVLGKNIWGAWPLIIWEATTSRTTVSSCPVLSNLCTVIILKIWGPGQDLGGLCPLGPNIEPPLYMYSIRHSKEHKDYNCADSETFTQQINDEAYRTIFRGLSHLFPQKIFRHCPKNCFI